MIGLLFFLFNLFLIGFLYGLVVLFSLYSLTALLMDIKKSQVETLLPQKVKYLIPHFRLVQVVSQLGPFLALAVWKFIGLATFMRIVLVTVHAVNLQLGKLALVFLHKSCLPPVNVLCKARQFATA